MFPWGIWTAPKRKAQSPVGGGCRQVQQNPHKPISLNMISPEGVDPPRSAVYAEPFFFFSLGVICGTSWWDINSFWRGKKIGTFKGPLFVILFSPLTNLLQWKLLAFRHPAQGYVVYLWLWVAIGLVNTEESEVSHMDKNSWSILNYVIY